MLYGCAANTSAASLQRRDIVSSFFCASSRAFA
jgi:hypothetical protein